MLVYGNQLKGVRWHREGNERSSTDGSLRRIGRNEKQLNSFETLNIASLDAEGANSFKIL